MSSSRSRTDDVPYQPFEPPMPEAPLSAGPPPLFDVQSFSDWMTEVFTKEHEDKVFDKLNSVGKDDDMKKMVRPPPPPH